MVCALAAAVLTAAVLTGCGAPKDCEGEGKITTIEKGVLKVGIPSGEPICRRGPFSFRLRKKQGKGLDIVSAPRCML